MQQVGNINCRDQNTINFVFYYVRRLLHTCVRFQRTVLSPVPDDNNTYVGKISPVYNGLQHENKISGYDFVFSKNVFI